MQSPAAIGGVQDGVHVLAGELALPGHGCVVGFPDDGPAKEGKVRGSTRGNGDRCLKEVETAPPCSLERSKQPRLRGASPGGELEKGGGVKAGSSRSPAHERAGYLAECLQSCGPPFPHLNTGGVITVPTSERIRKSAL